MKNFFVIALLLVICSLTMAQNLKMPIYTEGKIPNSIPVDVEEVIDSSDDKAVPVENSLLYYKALVKNNIHTEMHIYPYGGHGFSLAIGKGYLSSWAERCYEWLNNLDF